MVAEMFLGSKRGKIYKEADIVYARQLLILTADAVDGKKRPVDQEDTIIAAKGDVMLHIIQSCLL